MPVGGHPAATLGSQVCHVSDGWCAARHHRSCLLWTACCFCWAARLMQHGRGTCNLFGHQQVVLLQCSRSRGVANLLDVLRAVLCCGLYCRKAAVEERYSGWLLPAALRPHVEVCGVVLRKAELSSLHGGSTSFCRPAVKVLPQGKPLPTHPVF